MSNIDDLDRLVAVFIKQEDEHFSLFNYIQTVNQETDQHLEKTEELEVKSTPQHKYLLVVMRTVCTTCRPHHAHQPAMVVVVVRGKRCTETIYGVPAVRCACTANLIFVFVQTCDSVPRRTVNWHQLERHPHTRASFDVLPAHVCLSQSTSATPL